MVTKTVVLVGDVQGACVLLLTSSFSISITQGEKCK